MMKALIDADSEALASGKPRLLDVDFIGSHTHGFDELAADLRAAPWEAIERQSGLTRADLTTAARVYAEAKAVIAAWGMGITQHRHGTHNVQQIVNLLLLRGNIGRPGAGALPVRGHSNVQGDRTVGITERPTPEFLDRLKAVFGFEPPRRQGHAVVGTLEAIVRGDAKVFIGLGGNYVAAVPDTEIATDAMRRLNLTIGINTKLNRGHLVHGRQALILPCIRIASQNVCGVDKAAAYVLKIVDDASKPNPFSEDDYLRGRQGKSILCLPLIKQGRLTGLLYLENTLTSHAFTPDRIAVLELLAAQAAISLENTRLYSDLQEREAKVRRLVDSNIIGIYFWELEGGIIDANDTFLRMLGCDREDLVSGRVRWLDLTPPEWRERNVRAIEEIRTTGSLQPFEKEYFRKDGSRVPVLIGSVAFDGRRDQGVAFVLDLTERKRAEENLQESERRYREAQGELAHVTRVTMLGELTASIAREVNQPLAGISSNAEACLRWLDRGAPHLDAARRSVEWIINDCNRAGEVIQRVRALAKRANIRKEPLHINDVVDEVISLVRREMSNHRVSLRKELASGLPMVFVDRIQLQQVIINLVINSIEAMQSVTDRPRELTIRSCQDGATQVLVTVKDCGVGISAESVDRLFGAFFTTKPSGTGMGLSIGRSIIEAHGGRLWAESDLPQGAAFHFTLPLRQKTRHD